MIMVYEITGPLFFGVANIFIDIMNEVKNNTNVLILKMKNVPNIKASGFFENRNKRTFFDSVKDAVNYADNVVIQLDKEI